MTDTTSRVLMAVGTGLIVAAMRFGMVFVRDGRWQLGRRLYWTCWVIGVPVFVFGMQTSAPKATFSLAFWAWLSVGFAYVCTPYLTLGGHTYAFKPAHRAGKPDQG